MTSTTEPVAQWIEAGAVLPRIGAHAATTNGHDRDVITARRYQHPGLPDRAVVRLVPALLAPADDIAMGYLGFTEPTATTEVGVGRRQAVGFPAWALINDPANAHHALNLVKDLERIARIARSGAGKAWDALMALGEQLGRSAPHFLPTFYEQAARIYLAADSPTYATRMFGRAREAEQVYGLQIDPHRQRSVFLEFAFAGAVSAKVLSAYSRTLIERGGGVEAYEWFATLCIECCRGGLPPYAGMPEDLRRLAKTARISAVDADVAILRDLLHTASIARAGAGFWKSYRSALTKLAASDPAVRGRLLAFVPEATDSHAMWLAILTEVGATRALTESANDVPAAERAPAGPAGWLAMMINRRGAAWRGLCRSVPLLELVTAMTRRLRADGAPVDLAKTVELDLLDLLLAEGVPVAGADKVWLDVDGWLRHTCAGGRDLAALAASDRFGPQLVDRLKTHVGRIGTLSREAIARIMAVPGLRSAMTQWVAAATNDLAGLAIPEIATRLSELSPIRHAESYVGALDAARRIADIDIAGALERTLRGGLVDELSWPAFEAAVTDLIGTPTIVPGADLPVKMVGEAWPALILHGGERLVVVGPDGVLFDHVLRIPADRRSSWNTNMIAYFVNGVALVIWRGPDYEFLGYWSNNPDHIFAIKDLYQDARPPSIGLPDGSRFTGGRALCPGDHQVPAVSQVATDGVTYWSFRHAHRRSQWVETDVLTGDVGRASLPAFFEGFVSPDTELHTSACVLRSTAPGTEASPLGAADGQHGWRVRRTMDKRWEAERIDGERIELPANCDRPDFAVRLPGDQHSRIVGSRHYGTLILRDRSGAVIARFDHNQYRPVMARGTVMVPPDAWWHCLRPRDEAGSRALREVRGEQAEAMLAVVVAEREDGPDLLTPVVRQQLPGVTHPELIAGVAGVVRYAAELYSKIAEYENIAAEAVGLAGSVDSGSETHIDVKLLNEALGWISSTKRYYRDAPPKATTDGLQAIRALADAAAAGQPLPAPDLSGDGWKGLVSILPDWMPRLGSMAFRAASPFTPEPHRDALRYTLNALATTGFADGDGRWRTIIVVLPEANNRGRYNIAWTPAGFLLLLEGIYHQGWSNYRCWSGIQFTSRPGEFTLPSGWVLESATAWDDRIDHAWLAKFEATLAADGPVPWRPQDVPALATRTGMSEPEAALVLAGLPGVGDHESNFLPAEVRTTLGLKVAEANAGRQRIRGESVSFRHALLGEAMPADPAVLWSSGPDLERVAEHWIARFGRAIPLPADLIVAASQELRLTPAGTEVVAGLANPTDCRWLTANRTTRFDEHRIVEDGPGFGSDHLGAVTVALPWLAYRLAAADPIRANLTAALDLATDRVANPAFVYRLGCTYAPEKVYELAGIRPAGDQKSFWANEWLGFGYYDYRMEVYVRPSALDASHEPLLTGLTALPHFWGVQGDWLCRALYDAGLRAACAVRAPEGTDPGRYFQDPTLSVPDLVESVAATHGLDADAAALYLQLLALPDPTDSNITRWTGWKPARRKAATAALAGTDLVLSAKRSRAGRSLFLPGGWLPLSAPHLPIEEWKKPMFTFTADGQPQGPLVPRRPVAEAFRLAWQRVLDGDMPRYLELRTGGRR